MELQVIDKPGVKKSKIKYYSVPAEPRKKEIKSNDFFFIGNDKRVISLLLSNFDSGFYSDDLQKGLEVINMLIIRKISLPDAIIIQYGFPTDDLNHFLRNIKEKIHSIPVIIEGTNAPLAATEQFKRNKFIDDVFVLEQHTVNQLVNKIAFLKKIKGALKTRNVDRIVSGDKPLRVFSKKFFDIAFSLAALIFLSPVFFLIAALIKLESKGPAIYCSPRVGRGYRIFRFYKFRTMEVGADRKVHELYHLNQYNIAKDKKTPIFFKVPNDPRVTRIGNFLRNTSLDELPQLLNVLKGDMSIVGNRPLPLYEAERLTTDQWAERFLAPAGITGLWQIRKKQRKNMSIEERIGLDIHYAHKQNFAYDLWILANTPTALLQKEKNAKS